MLSGLKILFFPWGCCEQGLTSLVSILFLFNTFPWRLFVSLFEVQCAIFNTPFNYIIRSYLLMVYMCTCICVSVWVHMCLCKGAKEWHQISFLRHHPLHLCLPIPQISSKGHFIWPFSHGLQQMNSYLHTKHFADCAIFQISNNYCFCFTLIFYSNSQNIILWSFRS